MRYVCLIYLDEAKFAAMPKAEAESYTNEMLDYDDELRRSGHFIDAPALEAPETAATVRFRNGKPSVTDGPFAETKEHLGGFYLIEAKDLNEAILVAGKIPLARTGAVEVRAVKELERI